MADGNFTEGWILALENFGRDEVIPPSPTRILGRTGCNMESVEVGRRKRCDPVKIDLGRLGHHKPQTPRSEEKRFDPRYNSIVKWESRGVRNEIQIRLFCARDERGRVIRGDQCPERRRGESKLAPKAADA